MSEISIFSECVTQREVKGKGTLCVQQTTKLLLDCEKVYEKHEKQYSHKIGQNKTIIQNLQREVSALESHVNKPSRAMTLKLNRRKSLMIVSQSRCNEQMGKLEDLSIDLEQELLSLKLQNDRFEQERFSFNNKNKSQKLMFTDCVDMKQQIIVMGS